MRNVPNIFASVEENGVNFANYQRSDPIPFIGSKDVSLELEAELEEGGGLSPVTKIRKKFPETWIWTTVRIPYVRRCTQKA